VADNLTDSILTVSLRIFDLLTNEASLLGIEGVSYGDQAFVPKTPWACIEPGRKTRPLDGVPDMTLNEISVYILVYHSVVSPNPEATGGTHSTRMDSIRFAEAIEKWLHISHLNLRDAAGDRIVIHGWCTETDPGYTFKQQQQTLYNSVQLTWTGLTKTRLQQL